MILPLQKQRTVNKQKFMVEHNCTGIRFLEKQKVMIWDNLRKKILVMTLLASDPYGLQKWPLWIRMEQSVWQVYIRSHILTLKEWCGKFIGQTNWFPNSYDISLQLRYTSFVSFLPKEPIFFSPILIHIGFNNPFVFPFSKVSDIALSLRLTFTTKLTVPFLSWMLPSKQYL